jgi:hypothetical protein
MQCVLSGVLNRYHGALVQEWGQITMDMRMS